MKKNNNIYIYSTPESKAQGLIKIGDAINVKKRIKEQFNTAATFDSSSFQVKPDYTIEAITKSGIPFRDHKIHKILENKGYPRHKITDLEENVLKGQTEWFKIDIKKAIYIIKSYINEIPEESMDIERPNTFKMRPEQHTAVSTTEEFFKENSNNSKVPEFLWNAKMRFGKTFTAYQLAKKMNLQKVLILTYKPGVQTAWKDDLNNHIDFKNYVFLHEQSLQNIDFHLKNNQKIVVFASYQDLLGENSDGSDTKEKHKVLFQTEWDILIVDEFHYGSSTQAAKDLLENELSGQELTKKELKAREKELFSEQDENHIEEEANKAYDEFVKKSIKTKRKLFLSGTPFKALADNRFMSDAIFNWTYIDEQKAKKEWTPSSENEVNPYKMLPQIQLYVYKVSDEVINAGLKSEKDEFSLNYFFKVKSDNKFKNEKAVINWLNLISGMNQIAVTAENMFDDNEVINARYPYDEHSGFNDELHHTLWYFNRINSAVAMKKLLEEHPIFKQYHIELASGDNSKSGAKALLPVREAIDNVINRGTKKTGTITLTVGKLTTGVSVPEWGGVLFLRDTDSPENYFQTAFRAQTPYKDKNGKIKDKCYIFDFSPNRSLRLLTTYSEKLTSDNHLSSSEEKIEEFIKYLPVLKVSGNKMFRMDAREVLTFDLSGIDAKGLGQKFIEKKNIVVTSDIISLINANNENSLTCQDIFDRIKMFKKYSVGASSDEMKNSDADVISLDVNNGKIKDLNTKKEKDQTPEEKKELDKVEKESRSERDKVRELLKTLLSRIPLFMYLTDATEENMEQVLVEDDNGLFRKTTGIEVADFRFLIKMGLMKIDNLDGYVLKFNELEDKNYNYVNELI